MSAAELVVIADADRERRATRAGRLAWIGAAAIVVLVLAVQPFSNTDVWWNLALGRLITQAAFPRTSRSAFSRPLTPGSGSSGSTRSRSPASSAPAVPASPRWSWGL